MWNFSENIAMPTTLLCSPAPKPVYVKAESVLTGKTLVLPKQSILLATVSGIACCIGKLHRLCAPVYEILSNAFPR